MSAPLIDDGTYEPRTPEDGTDLDYASLHGVECPTCGSFPMGQGCYHICPNSVCYYSPEQEKADDPWYGMDDQRERYAGELIGLEDN
jgi:hypothetical protein